MNLGLGLGLTTHRILGAGSGGGGPSGPQVGWDNRAVNGAITVSPNSLTASTTSTDSNIATRARVRSIFGHKAGKRALRIKTNISGVPANDEMLIGLSFDHDPLDESVAGVGITNTRGWAVSAAGMVYRGSQVGNPGGYGAVGNGDYRILLVDFDNGNLWVGTDSNMPGDPEAGTGQTASFTPNILGDELFAWIEMSSFTDDEVSAEFDINYVSGTFLAWSDRSDDVAEPSSSTWSDDTLNYLSPGASLSNGDLTVSAVDDEDNYYARGTRTHTSGKRYFTVTIAGTQPAENGNEEVSSGIVRANWELDDGFSAGNDGQIVGDDGLLNNSDDLGFLVQAGQTFGVWVNFDTGKFWIGNTAEELAGDPETGTGETGSFTPGARMAPLVQLYATDPPNPVSATLGTTTDSGTYLGWDN